LLAERGIARQPQRLDCRDQVFTNKLAGPGNELGRWLPIAQAKHLEHPWIRVRGGQEPMIDPSIDAITNDAVQTKTGLCYRLERQRALIFDNPHRRLPFTSIGLDDDSLGGNQVGPGHDAQHATNEKARFVHRFESSEHPCGLFEFGLQV
jgi:hypothetical protein